METVYQHFTTIDSTNSYAKRIAEQLDRSKVTIIVADEQTAGRGRGKRSWVSPAKKNIYVSFCFFILSTRTDFANLSQVLAISAAKVLQKHHFDPQLKWPNDLLLNNKKVAGILCETSFIEDQIFIVMGIGLNVNMPFEILNQIDIPATSLAVERGEEVSLEVIFHELQKQFLSDLELFLQEGFGCFFSDYQKLMHASFNKKIRFHDTQKIWEGTLHSVNEDGSINLLLPTGERKRFLAGEILFEPRRE